MATRSSSSTLVSRPTVYGDENAAPTGLLGKSVLASKNSSIGVASKPSTATNATMGIKRTTLGDISNMSINGSIQDGKNRFPLEIETPKLEAQKTDEKIVSVIERQPTMYYTVLLMPGFASNKSFKLTMAELNVVR
jgi:hypothetical protein